MIFAVDIGLDTIATGGVTAMLVAVLVHMLRRTKDTDERRDEATTMVIAACKESEAKAWAERDKVVAEMEQMRRAFEEERRTWR